MEPGSNSKLLLIGGAAVALVIVVVGVRTLTSPVSPADETRPSVTKPKTDEAGDESNASSGSTARAPKVTSMGSSSKTVGPTPALRSSGPKPTGSGVSGFHHDASTTPVTTGSNAAQTTPSLTPVAEVADTEEAKENARKVADLTSMFKNEKDPSARIDLADELGLIDDPLSVRRLLELAETETDPEVKEALLNALTGLDALEQVGKEAVDALERHFKTSADADVRSAALDALGDIATADSKKALDNVYRDPNTDPSEKLTAAENILRIRTNDPDLVPIEEARQINEQLRLDFQAGTDAAFRTQAAMALALMGKENLPFFQQALTTEQDPNVKNLLEKLTKMQFGP
ncbi:MAG: HEAT repeat domain-containing protein [Candidatus Sumerlaeaceae bacterium]